MTSIVKSLLHKLHLENEAPQHVMSKEQLLEFFNAAVKKLTASPRHLANSTRLAGDKLTRFNGQGTDYSESRAYSRGDDSRLINWKQSAKSGELITNKYYQENENKDFLILDQRQNMFFGTKQQTKMAQAIKAAIVTSLSSISRHRDLVAIGIGSNSNLNTALSSAKEALSFFSALAKQNECSSCDKQISLTAKLRFLLSLKPCYSSVTIISDLYDLDNTGINALRELASNNHVNVIRVTDLIENTLPPVFPVHYQSVNNKTAILISNKKEFKALKQSIHSITEKTNHQILNLDSNVVFVNNETTNEELLDLNIK